MIPRTSAPSFHGGRVAQQPLLNDEWEVGAPRYSLAINLVPLFLGSMLFIVEAVLAAATHEWQGLLCALPAISGIMLLNRYPRTAVVLGFAGVAVLSVVGPGAVHTVTFLLILPVLVHCADGLWRSASGLAFAGFAAALWLSRGAGTFNHWGYAIGLWLILFAGAAAVGYGIWRARFAAVQVREQRWEAQRREIAQELHDSVAHQLSVISMRAEVARQDPAQAVHEVSIIADASRSASAALRGLMSVLRLEEEFRPVTLHEILDEVRTEFAQAGRQLTIEIEGDLTSLPMSVSDCLGRVTRESANNMLRHGLVKEPATILVEVRLTSVEAAFLNRWEGRVGEGLGLPGMEERVRAAGGTMRLSHEGGFWSVRVSLPYSPGARLSSRT